jgi:hypothetical protein
MATKVLLIAAISICISACTSSADRELVSPCGPLSSYAEADHCGQAKPVNPFTSIVVD